MNNALRVSVSAALAWAAVLGAGTAGAQATASPWSISFDLGTQMTLAGTGLEGINDETRRWSMPVTGGLTIRF